jgi:hypothetical protein
MSAVVGKVISVSGMVQAKDATTGQIRTLTAPLDVFDTEIIITSGASGIVLQFNNGDVLTLGPQNEYSLAEGVSIPDLTIDDSLSEENYPFDVQALQQAVLDGNFEVLEATAAGLSVINSASSAAFVLARAGLLGNVDAGFDTDANNTESNADRKQQSTTSPTEPSSRNVSFDESSVSNPFALDRTSSEGEVDSGYDTNTDIVSRNQTEDIAGREPVVITSNLTLTGSPFVTEGVSSLYTLNLDNPPNTSFTVTLQVVNGTTSNTDLDTTSITVEFAPGQQSATFSIDINPSIFWSSIN